MRKIWLKNIIVPSLYLLVYLYFAIFNWQIFTVSLRINLGFGMVEFPPFIVLFLIGFILVGILAWTSYMNSLRRLIHDLEKGIEYGKMKDQLVSNRVRDLLFDEQNIEQLKDKMGVGELGRRQEDILLVLNEMQKDTEEVKVQNRKES